MKQYLFSVVLVVCDDGLPKIAPLFGGSLGFGGFCENDDGPRMDAGIDFGPGGCEVCILGGWEVVIKSCVDV